MHKIVQSLWLGDSSLQKNSVSSFINRDGGGWLSKKYYYCSLAYSFSKAHEIYPNIELVANGYAQDLLLEKLGLQYTSVKELPNISNEIKCGLWAYPKLIAYQLQTTPFFHIDNDVFLWSALPERMTNAHLAVQNLEVPISVYRSGIKLIKEYFPETPDWLLSYNKYKQQPFIAVNAGLLGGTDINFIHKYSTLAIETIKRNEQLFYNNTPSLGDCNVVIEQLLFFQMANRQNKAIETLYSPNDNKYSSIFNFDETPFERQYVHYIGECKKKENLCKKLEYRLCFEYPDLYNKIISLVGEQPITETAEYINFASNYRILHKLKSKEDILNLQLTLGDDQQLKKRGSNYYRLDKDKWCKLGAWSTFMVLFYQNSMSGNELINNISNSYLGEHLSEECIRKNVFITVYQYLLNHWLQIC